MQSNPRRASVGSLLVALIGGYFVLGHYLYKLPIGLDPSAFWMGEAMQSAARAIDPTIDFNVAGLVWLIACILAFGVLAFFAVRSAKRAPGGAIDRGRRTLLTSAGWAFASMLVAAAAGAARGLFGLGKAGGGWMGINSTINAPVVKTHPEWLEHWRGSEVRSYRRLGRTGWRVSDIVLGTGPLPPDRGDEIVRTAIERGINYIDTSPDYSAAGSEEAVGRGIRGSRDKLFIATKFCSPIGHLPPGTPVRRYQEVVEASLRRLGTDYVDLCHIHSCDEVDRLMDPNVHDAFDQLKREGKVRFLGFSTHTPNLVEVANTGIASGRFDVIMPAYHHGQWAPLGEIIERARREQDMGVVAMKTLKGAKHHGLVGFREQADAYSQAALKWVLSNPDVSCAVISFFKLQHIDEYLYASGQALTPHDVAILEKYDREILGTYCAPHCGACLDSCPEGLPIHDILRHRMYFEDYGWEKGGMALYEKLEKNASACATCPGPCLGSCPVGIPIRERTLGAHELLTIS